MREISEATLREALNAEDGKWREMPFPADKIPDGSTIRSVQGHVKDTIFLVVEFKMPGQDVAYDGTFTLMPVTFGHLPPSIAKEAFLKGSAWLENQKPKA